jgi:pimeloyl-ACP methyl ester carboxylesterase
VGQRSVWQRIRAAWVALGSGATVVFVAWSLLAYRASDEARAALRDSPAVRVERGDAWWDFLPVDAAETRETGLIFFPGALVDPVAYAPLAHAVAAARHPAVLVEVPRRGGFGGADDPRVFERGLAAIRRLTRVRRWVLGGHSRGAVIASQLFRARPNRLGGLLLIASSHPRDFSLADTGLPVMKLYGTRDTVADVEKIDATRANLPAHTRWVRIDGGNHSQFAWYGFQPGDWPATVSRGHQQAATIAAVLDLLHAVDAGS